MSNVQGTFIGKHDFQLRDEMNAKLKEAGLSAHASFERRRGRVCLVSAKSESEKAMEIVLNQHPDLFYSYDNPSQGETRFIYFNQK